MVYIETKPSMSPKQPIPWQHTAHGTFILEPEESSSSLIFVPPLPVIKIHSSYYRDLGQTAQTYTLIVGILFVIKPQDFYTSACSYK